MVKENRPYNKEDQMTLNGIYQEDIDIWNEHLTNHCVQIMETFKEIVMYIENSKPW